MTKPVYLSLVAGARRRQRLPLQWHDGWRRMTHPGELAASAIVLVVAIIAAALTWVALRAQRRTSSRSLGFVAAAFGLFALKGLVVSVALWNDMLAHQHLEVVSALFDLGIVVLLFWPILR